MLSIKYIYKGKAGKRETYIYHCQQKWPALPSQPIWLKLDLTEKKRDEIDKAVSTKHKVFRPAKFFWFLTIYRQNQCQIHWSPLMSEPIPEHHPIHCITNTFSDVIGLINTCNDFRSWYIYLYTATPALIILHVLNTCIYMKTSPGLLNLCDIAKFYWHTCNIQI